MRIVFIGASTFGMRCLETITTLPCCEIVGAVTAPRHFSISYRPQGVTNVLFADVKSYCDSHNIECAIIRRNMKDPDLMDRVRSWAPDMFLVAGWYHMVPRPWREMAPAYGLHSSLLPDYSGGAPLVWAMINGETKTGITLFQLADGVDSGPVVGQLAADILPEDTIATLYQRIESLGIELLVKQLPRLANGSAQLTPQDESRRRLFPQRGPEDGIIDWSRPACQIYNFIRAQTKPYPGAFTFHQADKVTIWSSQLVPHKHFPFPPCGQIKTMDGQIFVGCGNESVLEITHIGMNGIDMPASIWWRERNKPGNNNAFSASLGKKEDAARP